MGATPGAKKERLRELVKKGLVKCGFCRPNRGENSKRHPRNDYYKDLRRMAGYVKKNVVLPKHVNRPYDSE